MRIKKIIGLVLFKALYLQSVLGASKEEVLDTDVEGHQNVELDGNHRSLGSLGILDFGKLLERRPDSPLPGDIDQGDVSSDVGNSAPEINFILNGDQYLVLIKNSAMAFSQENVATPIVSVDVALEIQDLRLALLDEDQLSATSAERFFTDTDGTIAVFLPGSRAKVYLGYSPTDRKDTGTLGLFSTPRAWMEGSSIALAERLYSKSEAEDMAPRTWKAAGNYYAPFSQTFYMAKVAQGQDTVFICYGKDKMFTPEAWSREPNSVDSVVSRA